MPAMRLGLNVSSQAPKYLRDVAGNAAHARPALAQVAELIAARNLQNWGRGKPLAASTLRQKKARGQPPDRLVATGKSKADLTSAKNGTMKLTDEELHFGTTRWQIAFASGTPTEPKRSSLAFTPKTKRDTRAIVTDHILPS